MMLLSKFMTKSSNYYILSNQGMVHMGLVQFKFPAVSAIIQIYQGLFSILIEK